MEDGAGADQCDQVWGIDGPPTGLWHVIPAAGEKLRVHRRFFKDIEIADNTFAAAR